MKFNIKQLIRTPEGENLNQDGKNITMGQFITDRLFMMAKDQSTAYRIAMSIMNSGTPELELPAEDVVFIKKAMEEAGTLAFVYGQVVEALEK